MPLFSTNLTWTDLELNPGLRVDRSGEYPQIVCAVKSNRIKMRQWAACLQLVVDQAKVVLVIVLIKYKYKVLARKGYWEDKIS